MATGMGSNTGIAGGFFLTLGIITGLVAGVMLGNTMQGVLVGTATGIVAALAVWLVDRRRRR